MIQNDQPAHFEKEAVLVSVSSYDDGNMSFSTGDEREVTNNRRFFLDSVSIDPLQTALVQVTFDTTDFTRYRIVDEDQLGEGILSPLVIHSADALVATRPGQALFLPLADCAGAVLYDTKNHVLMVSHLGRQSVEINGAEKSIEFLCSEFDSNPKDIQVWLSPMVGPESYPLHAFSDRGLRDVIIEQLISAGVTAENIEFSSVDTAESDNYFSHSEFLAGEQSEDGRFALIAVMTE